MGSENTLKVPENHSKDKNASGYSFEAVETHKSSWQMFKALVYLRTLMRFREPAMFFVQIVMPVIYICLGVFLSDLSEPNVNQDNEAILTPHMYEDDFYPYLYGFQNMLQSDPPFIPDFENFTGKLLKRIPSEVEFPDLLDKDLVTVLKKGIKNDDYIGYFNDTAQHSIPILINAMSNAYASLYDIGKPGIFINNIY